MKKNDLTNPANWVTPNRKLGLLIQPNSGSENQIFGNFSLAIDVEDAMNSIKKIYKSTIKDFEEFPQTIFSDFVISELNKALAEKLLNIKTDDDAIKKILFELSVYFDIQANIIDEFIVRNASDNVGS